MSPVEVLDFLSRIGVFGVAVVVIFLLLTGRIVTKGHIDEIRDELLEARKGESDALKRIEDGVNALRNRR